MDAVAHVESELPALMTWDEIRTTYPNQWVCVVDARWDEPRKHHLHSARVVASGGRHETYVSARPWRNRYSELGHYYTGKIVAPSSRHLL